MTAAIFNPYEPKIVIGGTHSGYIVQWDIREKTMPVQRSLLSHNGHTYPIFSLAIVGSANAHNIVSVSNDGRLCMWTLGMLNEPQKQIDLKKHHTTKSDEVSSHCIAFPDGEMNNFYVGAEDANIYHAQIHTSVENSDNVVESFAGHQASITGLHVHPVQQERNSDAYSLLLSSSVDWSVRLWHPKFKKTSLFTFESAQDYIYDVQWSPVHPSVFASCDGEGYLDLWDINKDIEVPQERFKTGEKALNKLRWSPDGKKIVTGDSAGRLSVWGVDKDYYQPKEGELNKLERLIRKE